MANLNKETIIRYNNNNIKNKYKINYLLLFKKNNIFIKKIVVILLLIFIFIV